MLFGLQWTIKSIIEKRKTNARVGRKIDKLKQENSILCIWCDYGYVYSINEIRTHCFGHNYFVKHAKQKNYAEVSFTISLFMLGANANLSCVA